MWPEPEMPEAWERWVRATGLHHFVADHAWLWPMSETLHYIGLSLLLGTVGLFDLRVLGMANMRELLAGQGLDIVASNPAEFASRVGAETAKWRKVIQEAGIKPE